MPPAKGTKKTAASKSLEQTLCEAADKMRGNLEAAEYKHVALGLVFLKYVSDAFDQRRQFLVAATADPAGARAGGGTGVSTSAAHTSTRATVRWR